MSKVEKILIALFLALGVTAVCGVLLLIRSESAVPYVTEVLAPEETEGYDWEAGLSDATYWLPERCALYQRLPDIVFVDETGKSFSIRQWQGKTVVLVYWASWCEDCGAQMARMRDYEALAEKYGDVAFLYINRTDGTKETRQTAQAYFEDLSLKGELYFDEGLEAYDLLGIHNIPTTLFLDREGTVKAWSPRQIESEGVFEALLKNAAEGSAASIASFVTEHLLDEAGGIRTAYAQDGAQDTVPEVLSESQGLGMLYACIAGDRALFDKLWNYVKENMWLEGLTAWRVRDGQATETNALVDDLRIYRALVRAQELWGDYEDDLLSVEQALERLAVREEEYVDLYDLAKDVPASRFTLCYGDLDAMQLLAQRTGDPALEKAYENALKIIEFGQISDEFPLYYSWYDYSGGRYERDDLNTAEAMLTLLHLARQDRLKNNTLDWLKAQMSGEGLKVRYTVKGKVAKGYNYESTAVYALVAMIADEIGDTSLRSQALKKMEKMHILDTSLAYSGAYGLPDGSGITSFDQLMPLLAYSQMDGRLGPSDGPGGVLQG